MMFHMPTNKIGRQILTPKGYISIKIVAMFKALALTLAYGNRMVECSLIFISHSATRFISKRGSENNKHLMEL